MQRILITLAVAVAALAILAGGAWLMSSPPPAAAAPDSGTPSLTGLRQIGEWVEYEGERLMVWGILTAKHRLDGQIYQYYLLGPASGFHCRYVWVGWIESGLQTLDGGDPGSNPPPNGGCPDPPGDPC